MIYKYTRDTNEIKVTLHDIQINISGKGLTNFNSLPNIAIFVCCQNENRQLNFVQGWAYLKAHCNVSYIAGNSNFGREGGKKR